MELRAWQGTAMPRTAPCPQPGFSRPKPCSGKKEEDVFWAGIRWFKKSSFLTGARPAWEPRGSSSSSHGMRAGWKRAGAALPHQLPLPKNPCACPHLAAPAAARDPVAFPRPAVSRVVHGGLGSLWDRCGMGQEWPPGPQSREVPRGRAGGAGRDQGLAPCPCHYLHSSALQRGLGAAGTRGRGRTRPLPTARPLGLHPSCPRDPSGILHGAAPRDGAPKARGEWKGRPGLWEVAQWEQLGRQGKGRKQGQGKGRQQGEGTGKGKGAAPRPTQPLSRIRVSPGWDPHPGTAPVAAEPGERRRCPSTDWSEPEQSKQYPLSSVLPWPRSRGALIRSRAVANAPGSCTGAAGLGLPRT